MQNLFHQQYCWQNIISISPCLYSLINNSCVLLVIWNLCWCISFATEAVQTFISDRTGWFLEVKKSIGFFLIYLHWIWCCTTCRSSFLLWIVKWWRPKIMTMHWRESVLVMLQGKFWWIGSWNWGCEQRVCFCLGGISRYGKPLAVHRFVSKFSCLWWTSVGFFHAHWDGQNPHPRWDDMISKIYKQVFHQPWCVFSS